MGDNPEEWFDVVDEHDRVIGRARRGEVHARNLLHRAVHILVQRSNGDVFLQRRSLGKDQHPGRWDSSASGHLDSGEDYDVAARRELREELGVETTLLRPLGSLPASEKTGFEFLRIYHLEHEGPFHLHPGEISEGRWFSTDEVEAWRHLHPGDFPPCFHGVWRAAGLSPLISKDRPG